MNQVILIGRLARDPELSYTPNTQSAICRFTIAVDRPRRNGEDAGADFIRITVWGRQVAVAGRIQTGSYKNREGVTVYTTDVVADRVEFLGGGQGGQNSGQGSYQSGFGGQDTRFDGSQNDFGRQESAPAKQSDPFGGFDDLPDTFQAAEDDIPF